MNSPVCDGTLDFFTVTIDSQVLNLASCSGLWVTAAPLSLTIDDVQPIVASVFGLFAVAWIFRFLRSRFF